MPSNVFEVSLHRVSSPHVLTCTSTHVSCDPVCNLHVNKRVQPFYFCSVEPRSPWLGQFTNTELGCFNTFVNSHRNGGGWVFTLGVCIFIYLCLLRSVSGHAERHVAERLNVRCCLTLICCFFPFPLPFRPVPPLPYRPPKTQKDCWDLGWVAVPPTDTDTFLICTHCWDSLRTSDAWKALQSLAWKGTDIPSRCYTSERCFVILAQVLMNYLSI